MKAFMDDNFLLTSEFAKQLYHNYAKEMPIFDYHCHLSPKEIYEDKNYKNLAEIWLGGDHYKWRAMRAVGINEEYITGKANDKEKFLKWAEIMPKCIGNPLYHWTHLELRRYFGIDELLSANTAETIWTKCNLKLESKALSVRKLIKNSKVKVLCTTDDPVDSLEYHQALAKDSTFNVKVLPAFRPDKVINIEKATFGEWFKKLEACCNKKITNLDELLAAIIDRLDFFHNVGCRISDHAIDPFVYEAATKKEVADIFLRALQNTELTEVEVQKYKTYFLVFLGQEYQKRNWVMQLHLGTARNINSRMLKLLGPDTGFDSMADYEIARPLINFLEHLEKLNSLPKTILYCLNPRDNELLVSIAGCFQGEGILGKVQVGSGWWFNDQKDGMIKQMTALASIGILSTFVGMLTDSRSFLSYTRHEYFRRILCSLIGDWVENGEVPDDEELLGTMVQDICYNNAERYFAL